MSAEGEVTPVHDTHAGAPTEALDPANDDRFRRAFERSHNLMFLVDSELRIVDANPAACEFLETPCEQLRQRSIEDFSPPDQRSRLPELLNALLAAGHLEGSFESLLPDGERRPVEFSATADVVPGCHLAIVFPRGEEARAGGQEEAVLPREGDPYLLTPVERQLLGLVATGVDTDKLDEILGLAPPETARIQLQRAVKKIETQISSGDLTPREVEVLRVLAMGSTPKQAGARLGISYDTVRVHVRNAMRKLGAKTQAHAIAIALKRGLIAEP